MYLFNSSNMVVAVRQGWEIVTCAFTKWLRSAAAKLFVSMETFFTLISLILKASNNWRWEKLIEDQNIKTIKGKTRLQKIKEQNFRCSTYRSRSKLLPVIYKLQMAPWLHCSDLHFQEPWMLPCSPQLQVVSSYIACNFLNCSNIESFLRPHG